MAVLLGLPIKLIVVSVRGVEGGKEPDRTQRSRWALVPRAWTGNCTWIWVTNGAVTKATKIGGMRPQSATCSVSDIGFSERTYVGVTIPRKNAPTSNVESFINARKVVRVVPA